MATSASLHLVFGIFLPNAIRMFTELKVYEILIKYEG